MEVPHNQLAQRRLAIAVVVSLLLHGWLMQGDYRKGAAIPDAAERALAPMSVSARIQSVVPEAHGVPVVSAAVDTPPRELMSESAAGSPRPQNVRTSTRAAVSAAMDRPDPSATSIPQPVDPAYYAAGDLDVFPKALVRPDLGAVLAANREPVSGKVRATLWIDEAGVVKAVREVQAAGSDVETAARDLLFHTRFTPARNKDGRIVKAQVVIALDYDTRGSAAR